MKGTGVPFTLKNCKTDQSTRRNPPEMKGTDMMTFNGVVRSLGNPRNLSTFSEKTTNNTTKVKKKIKPKGVRRVRNRLLLVAAL